MTFRENIILKKKNTATGWTYTDEPNPNVPEDLWEGRGLGGKTYSKKKKEKNLMIGFGDYNTIVVR